MVEAAGLGNGQDLGRVYKILLGAVPKLSALRAAWGARMVGYGKRQVQPKIVSNGMVVSGERRASLVRGLARPECSVPFFGPFLGTQERTRCMVVHHDYPFAPLT